MKKGCIFGAILAIGLMILSGCSGSSQVSELEAEVERLEAALEASQQLVERMMEQQNALGEEISAHMGLDKAAETFYDFHQAGITTITILDAAADEENLGYGLEQGTDGQPLFYDVICGVMPADYATDPAIYPASSEGGRLCEVRAVLRLVFDNGTSGIWVYADPLYDSSSHSPSRMMPMESMIPYTEQTMVELTCPIYVKDGVVNTNGKAEYLGSWGIDRIEGDEYHLIAPGGAVTQVTKEMLEWPDPEIYPPFDPTLYH